MPDHENCHQNRRQGIRKQQTQSNAQGDESLSVEDLGSNASSATAGYMIPGSEHSLPVPRFSHL